MNGGMELMVEQRKTPEERFEYGRSLREQVPLTVMPSGHRDLNGPIQSSSSRSRTRAG